MPVNIIRKLASLPFLLFYCLLYACNVDEQTNDSAKMVKTEMDTIPYTIFRNHIIVDAVIQDSVKARLVYDTGAGLSLYLDRTFLIQHNWFDSIEYGSSDQLSSARRHYIDEIVKFRNKKLKFSIGNRRETSINTGVFNLQEIIGTNGDGIIGKDFMSNYVVEVNYDNHYLVLHDPNKFTPPKGTTTLPVTFNKSGHMLFNTTFRMGNGKSFEYETVFDLGAGSNQITIIGEYLVNKFDLIRQIPGITTGENINYFGAKYKTLFGNIQSIEFAGINIDTPRLRIMYKDQRNSKNGGISYGISIGNYIFSKFGTIYIDYAQNKVYLAKIPK